MANAANVKLGVCNVSFNSIDLGLTKGGVEVTVSTEKKSVEVDQFGKTPVNEIITGRTVKVKVPLAETTLENLVATMPGAVLVKNGSNVNIRVDVSTGIGTDLLAGAKELRLHPAGLLATNHSEDFVIPLAASAGSLNFAYKLEDERIFDVEFVGYPNSTTGKLFHYGSET